MHKIFQKPRNSKKTLKRDQNREISTSKKHFQLKFRKIDKFYHRKIPGKYKTSWKN